jgi:hypothetical protein
MARGKKTGGRIAGTPNKVTAEAKSIAQLILCSLDYRDSVQARVKEGNLPPAVECMLWHYAYGKPRETMLVEGEMPPFRLVIDDGTNDTDGN